MPRENLITRCDIRIPNDLYNQIQEIAVKRFNAPIHHRSGLPEVTPTILKLIEIGIAHLDESSEPLSDTRSDKLASEIKELKLRLDKLAVFEALVDEYDCNTIDKLLTLLTGSINSISADKNP